MAINSEGIVSPKSIEIPEDIVSKEYVDEAIEEVESKIPSIEGLATEQYVNGLVETKQDVIDENNKLSVSLVDGAATSSELSEKQDVLVSGTNIKTINNQSILGEGNLVIEGGSGTSDYDQLQNRPQISGITLSGNKSLSDLGIASASDLDSKADASTTYTKTEVDTALAEKANVEDIQELVSQSSMEEYVSSQIEGLATEQYVDDAIAAIHIPEGIDTLTEDVADLKDEMAGLIEDSEVKTDLLPLATRHLTGRYIQEDGSIASTEGWETYVIPCPEDAKKVEYSLYLGSKSLPLVAFWNANDATSVGSSNFLGGATCTKANSLNTGEVEIMEGTTFIGIANKVATGEATATSVAGQKGTVPAMQDEIDALAEVIEDLVGKKVKDGLRIAVVGDSISTSTNNKMPEIKITAEDVGHQLGAWLTYHDVSATAPLTLGGVTYTTDDIGKYIIFTPTSEDVGKTIGNEKIYNSASIKVWWEYLMDLGADICNATWSSASLSSHEKTNVQLQTSYGWHDSQIRRCGKRIAGTMQRQAPDIVIVYRGTNDMTHSPYAKLTNNYFNGTNWTYPTDDALTAGGYGYKEAVSVFINKIHKVYPRARIVLATLNNFKRLNCSKFPVHNGTNTLQDYDKAIREAAEYFGLQTVDFDKDGITFENMYPYYISDSSTIPTHPNNNGHKAMGLQAIKDLDTKLDLYNFVPQNLTGLVDHQIVTSLANATVSTSKCVYTGETFTCQIEPEYGYLINTVTVKMGGDVVTGAYDSTTHTITVENVTGDIEISNTSSEATMYNITQNLTNVTSSFVGDKIAEGDSTITITANAGYAVMGDVSITVGGDTVVPKCSMYANKCVITLEDVDGDVVITATGTIVGDGTSYTVLESLNGVNAKAIQPIDDVSEIKNVYTKVLSYATTYGGFGCYGDIFAVGYNDGAGSHQYGTGASLWTGVAQGGNKEYIIGMEGVNATESTLKIYDGADFALTNVLGQVSRSKASGAKWLYFNLANTSDWTDKGNSFQWSYVIDSTDNMSHFYIPVQRKSDSATGLYDMVTNNFYTWIDRPTS